MESTIEQTCEAEGHQHDDDEIMHIEKWGRFHGIKMFPVVACDGVQAKQMTEFCVKQKRYAVSKQEKEHQFAFYELIKIAAGIFDGKLQHIVQHPVSCDKINAVSQEISLLIFQK